MASKPKRRGGSYLLLTDFERLEAWCKDVDRLFHQPPYLVGSVIERPDFRDVDLRMILPDAVYDRWWADPLQTRIANHAISVWGQRETGLPIDFQIQRQTEANTDFPDGFRNAMGIRDWATLPLKGTGRPNGRKAGSDGE